jgi:hypothetical protein
MALEITVIKDGMVVDEITYRQQLIAKNTVAAKRERKAQDKRKADRPTVFTPACHN